MHLLNGTLLQGGKYRIVRYISSGGFGCTYEAEHVMLGERVAIKEFFVKDFCNRDEATAHVTIGTQSKQGLVKKLKGKFVEEAKMLYRMQHPGIVHVSDIFEENSTAYYVMNYINGSSLSEIVATEGRLTESRALKYIHQVANALKYVHGHDRLHLDIKPGNIMVDEEDNAILIDFGASKQYDEVDGENTSTLLGMTPGYAPLEQIGNNVVKFTPATDIYSLGATLYKLLTGLTPPGANLLASGEELQELPDIVSQPVREAVAKSMEINKNRRPQNIAEFLSMLGSDSRVPALKMIEEDTLPIGESTEKIENNSIRLSQKNPETKNWRELFRERHSIVNIMLVLLAIGALGIIMLAIYGLFFESYMDADWRLYGIWVNLPLFCMGILVLIGLKQLFNNRLRGFGFISTFIPIINLPFPISVLVLYNTHYELFLWGQVYFWTFWIIAPIIGLLILYGVLHIKYEGKSAWSLMEPTPAWMKKVSLIAWILLGIAMFAILP